METPRKFYITAVINLEATSIFMLPQITSNRRYEWMGFYVNLSTLSRGNLTINVQNNHPSIRILYIV